MTVTQSNSRTIITKDNLNEVFEHIIVGTIRAQNYNSECFSSSDITHATSMHYLLDTFIERTINAGYCQYALLNELLTKYGYFITGPKDPKLKQEADDDFNLDMSEFEYLINRCYNGYESAVEAINEGYMKYR